MSRLRRIVQRERYFFITTNVAKGVGVFSSHERTCVLESLGQCRTKLHFKLFAYVVMPSHVHFLFEPGENQLSAVLRIFKSSSALKINHLRRAKWRYMATAVLRYDLQARQELFREN
jgi:REP element-mobilizing transposase RayT